METFTTMQCPHHQSPLIHHRYEDTVEVDRCGDCGGMFLDPGELNRIQEVTENDYRDEIQGAPDLIGGAHRAALAKAKPSIRCPKCLVDGDSESVEMERREHGYTSQIFVDVCPQCRGVWLDAGEIEALEIFFERAQVAANEIRPSYFATLRNLFGGVT